MIDPRQLSTQPLDTNMIEGGPGFYDEDEPLELEGIAITASDVAHLSGIPLSVDRCTFVGCDLSLFTLVVVKNSLVRDTKLRGTRFLRSIENVVFDGCQLTECVFRMITIKRTGFERSTLESCDFYGSTLTDLAFPASVVSGVGFDRCEIDGLDLTQAADLLIGDPRTLQGATITETQVPLIGLRLAQLSGINVHEH